MILATTKWVSLLNGRRPGAPGRAAEYATILFVPWRVL
jgi:hypothetical protein